jgi:hypothetical protein
MWYSSLALIVVLGTLLVYSSREARASKLATSGAVPPRANKDHWHAAYGIDICGLVLPPIAEDRDPVGIHTHKAQSGTVGDGIIHVHPFTSASAGKNATLGVFADTVGLTLSKTTLQVPGGKKYTNGQKCDNKPAFVRVAVDGKEVTGDPRKIRFTHDQMLIMIAFLPRGEQIPSPPSQVNLAQLSDVAGQQQPAGPTQQTPVAPATPTPTSAPGTTGTTAASSSTTATTAKK